MNIPQKNHAENPVISIIGGTIWGNRGAEAMLVTTIGKLREPFPDARFNVFSYYPSKDRELVADAAVTILSAKPILLATRHFFGTLMGMFLRMLSLNIPQKGFFRIAGTLSQSDILLDIGGITFSDGREKYLPFNILTIWPAMMLGVPVVKLAQAAGPFHNPLNRLLAKIFLSRCRHFFARGEKTAEFLLELGLPDEQYDLTADIAFLYQPEFSLSAENETLVQDVLERMDFARKKGKKIVVFSPSILVLNESRSRGLDYIDRFLSVMRDLGGENFHFVFMPNATRQGSDKPHNNDLLVLEEFRNSAEGGALPEEYLTSVSWIDFDINTSSVRKIVSRADALVCSRYHAMISGLAEGIPTVVVGWGHKYRETMEYFDMTEYSINFAEHEIDLSDLVRSVLENRENLSKKIKQKQPAVLRLAEKQFEYLYRELA